jgi:mono/diheme cytochrome c family protein
MLGPSGVKLAKLRLWSVGLLLLLGAQGCASEAPLASTSTPPITDAGSHDVSSPMPDGGVRRPEAGEKPTCMPLQSSEPIPARIAVISATASMSTKTYFVKDLFNLFRSTCGGCHVDGNQGYFHVDLTTFPTMVGQNVIDRLTTEDPTKVMPPGGKVPSQRTPDDLVSQLLVLIQTWMGQGSPVDVFTVPQDDTPVDGGASHYLMTEQTGLAMTNIGNCVPNKPLVSSEQKKAADLDTVFALLMKKPPGQGTPVERVGLPEHLEDTDLFTFDEQELARYGVIPFAPAYPLWSDNARKVRHLRVPQGQSIRFNKETQSFEIPPNTRIYKTFFKRIIDSDGSERYRKIETRLIVARPDLNHADGTVEQTALFGTYAWNDDETSATLVTDPLRDGEPFRDRLITYITDEVKAQQVRDSNPANLETALRKVGAIRSYAIPGSDRCIQCHMGSPSQSFILGFTPLQIRRRPLGIGGVIEPAGPDELTQLDRLIEYGIITGMDNPGDVRPLEQSEGDRTPRNDYELRAQGYMVGNCAHCHNPRGFPSVSNPVLVPLLNFLPGPNGGIFQFPLDRVSPRISRSVANGVQMPYITPSLADYPTPILNTGRPYDMTDRALGQEPNWTIAAPWRSLIYRNVDTPFAYAADLALLPHMPMNVPGYDCRVPRIMGDWMVSIPAARVNPGKSEFAMPSTDCSLATGLCTVPDSADTNAQPYVEVKPDDPGYEQAVEDANTRLFQYHDGRVTAGGQGVPYSRYTYCPDTTDIVDPSITGADRLHLTPADLQAYLENGKVTFESQNVPQEPVWPKEGIPDHPHWVVTDITDNPGDWVPRRSDWDTILRSHMYPDQFPADQKQVVEMLTGSPQGSGGITLSQAMRDYALKDAPFGLWKQNAGCSFQGIPNVGSFTGPSRPRWIDEVTPPPPPDAPVYSELPGAAVFNMICINCHGVKFDSRGRQADTLMLMTGGETRVANLRDGFFGPTTNPAQNRDRVFAPLPDAGTAVTADDWSARYLVWMGLGGTAKVIPTAITAVVANTSVLGVSRFSNVESANMLSSAQNLCSHLVGRDFGLNGAANMTMHDRNHPEDTWHDTIRYSPLISSNGDAELWAHLCTLDNAPPIRGISVAAANGVELADLTVSFFAANGFPANRPVGNDRGAVDAALDSSTNLMPWCIIKPESVPVPGGNATAYANAHTFIDGHKTTDGKPLPICPDELFPSAVQGGSALTDAMTKSALNDWATRGAVNAGFSVFFYLDQVERGKTPVPPYDHCEQLQ